MNRDIVVCGRDPVLVIRSAGRVDLDRQRTRSLQIFESLCACPASQEKEKKKVNRRAHRGGPKSNGAGKGLQSENPTSRESPALKEDRCNGEPFRSVGQS